VTEISFGRRPQHARRRGQVSDWIARCGLPRGASKRYGVSFVVEHLDNREGKLAVEDAWKIVGLDEAHRTQEHNRRLGDAMKKAGWSHGRRRQDGNLRYAYVKGESDRWLRVTRAGDLQVGYDDEKDEFAQAHGTDALFG